MNEKQYHYHVAYQIPNGWGSITLHCSKPLNSTRDIVEAQKVIREANGLEKDDPVVILNFIKLTGEEEDKDVVKTCDTCLYEDGYIDVPPCSLCTRVYDKPPSHWEPKEGEG